MAGSNGSVVALCLLRGDYSTAPGKGGSRFIVDFAKISVYFVLCMRNDEVQDIPFNRTGHKEKRV
jgi:hypothetical protein